MLWIVSVSEASGNFQRSGQDCTFFWPDLWVLVCRISCQWGVLRKRRPELLPWSGWNFVDEKRNIIPWKDSNQKPLSDKNKKPGKVYINTILYFVQEVLFACFFGSGTMIWKQNFHTKRKPAFKTKRGRKQHLRKSGAAHFSPSGPWQTSPVEKEETMDEHLIHAAAG